MDLKNEPRSPESIVPVQVVQNVNTTIPEDAQMPGILDSYPSMQHAPMGMGISVNNGLMDASIELTQIISHHQEQLPFDSRPQLESDGNMVQYSMFSNLTEEMTSMAADYMDCSESVPYSRMSPDLQTLHIPKVKKILPKKFKCAMCVYRTRYKSDLNRHVRKHAVAGFNCDICNMPFKTSGNVEFHKRKQHGAVITKPAEPVKYKCKYCNYDTLYSSDLTRHIRKHGIAKFHCGMCNRPFMTSGTLVQHKRTYHNLENLEIVMGLGGMETVTQRNVSGGDSNVGNNPSKNREPINGNDNSEVIDLVDDDDNCNQNEEETNRINSMIEVVRDVDPSPVTTQSKDAEEAEGAELSSEEEDDSRGPDPDLDPEPDQEQAPEHHSDPQPVPEHEKRLLVKISGASTQKYKCPHCEKTFGRKLVLEFHLRSFHKMKKTAQKIWRKTADVSQSNTRETTLSENAKAVTKSSLLIGMRHKCPYCSYGTMYKSTYDRHVKKHEFACYLCSLCNMPFITLGHLLKHKRQTHPDDLSDYCEGEDANDLTCPHCDFIAKDSGQLRLHCDSTHRLGHPRYISHQAPATPGLEVANDRQTQKTDMQTSVENQQMIYQTAKQQRTALEERVSSSPPQSGRYAKLVSDYDQFAEKPFACALCFFRTADVQVLVRHVEHHLTGCNKEDIPQTARVVVPPPFSDGALQVAGMPGSDLTQMFRGIAYPSQSAFLLPCQCAAVNCQQQGKNCQPSGTSAGDMASRPTTGIATELRNAKNNQNLEQKLSGAKNIRKNDCTLSLSERMSMDPIVPTFSVHYRKDRNKRPKPYICLMCKKRFSHLVLLKQHFKMLHSNITSKVYQCTDCSKLFNDPMLLQEHYDTVH